MAKTAKKKEFTYKDLEMAGEDLDIALSRLKALMEMSKVIVPQDVRERAMRVARHHAAEAVENFGLIGTEVYGSNLRS